MFGLLEFCLRYKRLIISNQTLDLFSFRTLKLLFCRLESFKPTKQQKILFSGPPPSYDSLFGRVREARKTSKGIVDFLKNILIIILGAVGCTVILGVTIIIPICMVVMGIIYLHDCPREGYIPVYLLVGGT